MSGTELLRDYLAFAGILCCNINPYLPCLSDIGCTWQDLTQLIDEQGLFYCKAYRGRSVYLSLDVYFLQKALSRDVQLDDDCKRLLDILAMIEPASAETLKKTALMEDWRFTKALQALLAHMKITALKSGRVINPNWTAFEYCLADTWERHVKAPDLPDDPANALQSILRRTMKEEEFARFAKQNLRLANT